jgi:chitodextrinase
MMISRRLRKGFYFLVMSLLLVVGSLPIGNAEVSAATSFSDMSINTLTPAVNSKFEMTFNLSTTYTNPFDPDEVNVTATFITPTAQVEVVPGFYKSNSSPKWAVRYSPRESGSHTVVLQVTDASGVGQSSTYSFSAGGPGTNRGFMTTQGERFVDSFGSQITLLGSNFAWNSAVNTVMDEIPNLKPAKMNILRVWYSCWWSSLAPEWGPIVANEAGLTTNYEGIGRYQLDNQDRMDQMLETAEENDVYIMLTMNSFGDFYYQWSVNAYNQANGGPSSYTNNNADFWTNPTAIAYQKKLMRYMFARFGYSRALGMLEYWNESDNRVDTSAVIRANWHETMDNYWKDMDFYDHPTTTSYAWKDHAGSGQQTWETLTTLDATNIHRYDPNPNIIDVWQSLIDNLQTLAPGKPAFIGEVGRSFEDKTTDLTIKEYFHDSLWGPMFRAGAAGGSLWWIFEGGFALPTDFKAYLTRLADFVQPVEEHLIDLPHVDYGLQSNNTKVGGFKDQSRAYLWINDTQANYTITSPRTVSGMSLTLPMDSGFYDVTYYDTYTGTYGSTVKMAAAGGSLVLNNIPAFTRDIAVKIESDGTDIPDTTAPTAPTNLLSSLNTDTTVSLSWSPSLDDVGVTGYDIYRNGSIAASVSGGVVTYKDTGLTAASTYSYYVKARDKKNNTSAASNTISVTTVAALPPSLLSNASFESSDSNHKPINWVCGNTNLCYQDTSVSRSGASSMRMTGNSGQWSGFYQDVPATASETYTWSGYYYAPANAGTTTEFRLRFLDASNNIIQDHLLYAQASTTSGFVPVTGSRIAPANTVTARAFVHLKDMNGSIYFDDFSLVDSSGSMDTQAPSVPTGLTSPVKTETTVSLTWTASTDNISVAGYEIYQGTMLVGSTLGETAFTVTELTANTTYSFTVRAKDAAGNFSQASSALNVTTNAVNLLLNPGFETDNGAGKPSSWTFGHPYNVFRDTTIKRTGNASLKISETNQSWFPWYQDVSATAGKLYTFDGYVSITANSGTNLAINVRFLDAGGNLLADNSVATYAGTTTSGFVNVHGAYTAPANTATVRVYSYIKDLNATMYFDDFSLT